MKKSIFVISAALLAGSIFFQSCKEEDPIEPVITNSRVLVLHASPDAPGVDLLVDNVKVNNSALTFPNNTGYLTVASGARNFKVNVAGTPTTVIDANATLTADASYTIIAANTVASIEPIVLEDNLTAPAAGKAHVRFIHLSPDAPAVDIAVTGGPVLFPNASFKSATAFTPVDAGTYSLEARVAGTTNAALTVPGVVLESGKIYTVFARGLLSGTGESALNASIIVNN